MNNYFTTSNKGITRYRFCDSGNDDWWYSLVYKEIACYHFCKDFSPARSGIEMTKEGVEIALERTFVMKITIT